MLKYLLEKHRCIWAAGWDRKTATHDLCCLQTEKTSEGYCSRRKLAFFNTELLDKPGNIFRTRSNAARYQPMRPTVSISLFEIYTWASWRAGIVAPGENTDTDSCYLAMCKRKFWRAFLHCDLNLANLHDAHNREIRVAWRKSYWYVATTIFSSRRCSLISSRLGCAAPTEDTLRSLFCSRLIGRT